LRRVRIGLAFSAEALADFFAAPGAVTFVGFVAAFAAGFGAADFEAAAFLAGAFLVVLSAVFATGNSLE
jgi:hypothetical protein